MKLRRAFAIGILIVAPVFAQTPEDGMRPRIATVHYPPLGELAGIQGDVHLHFNSGVITLLSGHPLLARTATDSAKELGLIRDKSELDVTYHFVLVDPTVVPTSVTVKRGGDALERAMLRLFGLKTEKVVVVNQCQEGVPPRNDVKLDGAKAEIWIYGRARCIELESATIAARR
jgi:hypothetical protein